MSRLTRLFTGAIVALTAVGLVPAHGAGSAKPDAKEAADGTASFRFLRFAELPALCVKDAAGAFVPAEAYTGFIGRPVRLSVKDPVRLFTADDKGSPVKVGDKPAPPLATFTPLADTPRQLVVLFGDAKAAQARLIPDNPLRFPFGRVLAVNLTDLTLVMDIGGAPSKLPPGAATLCSEPGGFVGENNTAIRITKDSPEHERVYSTVWTHSTDVRTLAFIYRNESGRIVVRTVKDANVPGLAEATKGKPAEKKPEKTPKS